jgi:hypothetical protein
MSERIHELLHRNLQEVFGEGDPCREPKFFGQPTGAWAAASVEEYTARLA